MIWSFKAVGKIHLWVNLVQDWAVVVAQLVEPSLPTPEIRCSIPNIGKVYLPIVNEIEKTKINIKMPGLAYL